MMRAYWSYAEVEAKLRSVVKNALSVTARSSVKRAVRPAALLLGVSLIVASATLAAATSAGNSAPAAVAAPDRYAARVAAEVLADGGNAIDAAVAVAFVLAVTYPEAGNLGGGGFATVFFEGNSYFLDYRECAPASATAGMYLDAHGEVIADASTVGAGAAAVPGTVEGLWQLHRRFARRTWSRDLAPAIRLAHEGFQVGRMQQATREARAAELHGRTNSPEATSAPSVPASTSPPARAGCHAAPDRRPRQRRVLQGTRTAELDPRRDGTAAMATSAPRTSPPTTPSGASRWPGTGLATTSSPPRCPAPAALPSCRSWQ